MNNTLESYSENLSHRFADLLKNLLKIYILMKLYNISIKKCHHA